MSDTSKPSSRKHPLRFLTAASLFDGHDAAINLIRRLVQAEGAEVIHLGHNRSVQEILKAALEEDVDAIAISSYQGGHMEFFRYLVQQLNALGASHIRVFGGGGGTFTKQEAHLLEKEGVERIYLPEDGMKMGLKNMILDLIKRTLCSPPSPKDSFKDNTLNIAESISNSNRRIIGNALTQIENHISIPSVDGNKTVSNPNRCAVLGITGTGGAGKSSLTDEILNRFCLNFPEYKIAILAIDPTRRRSGGALLGDRIRMNSLRHPNLFMRSIATRRQHRSTSRDIGIFVSYLKNVGFDLIMIETAGTGQSDSDIIDIADKSIYVMTSDFGAPSQLEKIDMLDFADFIVINKFEKKGSLDALRDVRKQYRRNQNQFQLSDDELPIYPTIASRFNDPGVNHLFISLCEKLSIKPHIETTQHHDTKKPISYKSSPCPIIPTNRIQYLSEIASTAKTIQEEVEHKVKAAQQAQHYYQSLTLIDSDHIPSPLETYNEISSEDQSLQSLREGYNQAIERLSMQDKDLLKHWSDNVIEKLQPQFSIQIANKTIQGCNYTQSISGNNIPKLACPKFDHWGEQLRFMLTENFPGHYPYTMGVYPHRNNKEMPTRMFAGEGTPEQTNRRFHFLAKDQSSNRLSTAFDSVTLYGHDPDQRPDIYGKVGNSGVSIATLDDMKKLYSGFNLCDPATSVSMTINGPAPILLAFYLNTAIDQQVEIYLKDNDLWEDANVKIDAIVPYDIRPKYIGNLPEGHNQLGLGLLGVTGDQLVDHKTYQRIKKKTFKAIRGTIQADILKEDQAQNTCIFSTEFALNLMADIQEFFITNEIKKFYSVSISGYHIAEAGANPITQLAFTLANGFTIVEYYLSRGMKIDDFAPNLSFFFSNGMDAEYAVIGRVARRIWARAMKENYQASEPSQKLKYHIQTSGRSLHAQEMDFNDTRTTLQALYALLDNCNSLHTNAYDEAVTTPTESSVRRALAIQLIINKELGLNACENAFQGSYLIEQLTNLVENSVYQEFESLSERGGVLGAMDHMYQRSKIQEESLFYEHKKHNGEIEIVGVNIFTNTINQEPKQSDTELIRARKEDKDHQIQELEKFKKRHQGKNYKALSELKKDITEKNNAFATLLETSKVASLEEITQALFSIGGQYRRNM